MPRHHQSIGMPALALVAALTAALLAPVIAHAHSYRLGDISIGHLWAKPMAADAAGIAVYGPVLKGGSDPVTLVGATSPAADTVRIRSDRDGVETFADRLTFQPGKPLALAPWREHLWLTVNARPVVAGERIPLTLDFGDAGTIAVEVMVEEGASD